MFRILTIAGALAMTLVLPAQAAPFNAAAVQVDNSSIVTKVRARLTGKQRLHRLLRQHYRAGNPITQSVRDATGNPRITILDRRVGGGTHSCSYRNFRKNSRVLVCN